MKRVECNEDGWFVEQAGERVKLSTDQVRFLRVAIKAGEERKQIDVQAAMMESIESGAGARADVLFHVDPHEMGRRLAWTTARVLAVAEELGGLGLLNSQQVPS